MNTFDLQKALDGKGVRTVKGIPVLICGVNYNADFPNRLFGYIDGVLHTWYVDGRKHPEPTSYSDFDLEMCDEDVKCHKCTCNKNVCITDYLGGSLKLRSLK